MGQSWVGAVDEADELVSAHDAEEKSACARLTKIRLWGSSKGDKGEWPTSNSGYLELYVGGKASEVGIREFFVHAERSEGSQIASLAAMFYNDYSLGVSKVGMRN